MAPHVLWVARLRCRGGNSSCAIPLPYLRSRLNCSMRNVYTMDSSPSARMKSRDCPVQPGPVARHRRRAGNEQLGPLPIRVPEKSGCSLSLAVSSMIDGICAHQDSAPSNQLSRHPRPCSEGLRYWISDSDIGGRIFFLVQDLQVWPEKVGCL